MDIIELWRDRLCLYDIESKSFSNKETKKQAVQEIANKLSMTTEAVMTDEKADITTYSVPLAHQTTTKWKWICGQNCTSEMACR